MTKHKGNPNYMEEGQETARNGDKSLSPRQEKGLYALLSHSSVIEASRQSGIPERTLHKWIRLSSFRERLELERALLRYESLETLKTSIKGAIEKLQTLLNSKSENIQLRTAVAIVDYFLRLSTSEDIEQRLSNLEGKKAKDPEELFKEIIEKFEREVLR
jgi:hypothetical protein